MPTANFSPTAIVSKALAQTLTTGARTVTVQRDEEHNRYLLQVEDRSNGYARHHSIGVDFVTAGEYRTLLANRRDIPILKGEIVVSTSTDQSDEASEEVAAADSGAAGTPPDAASTKPGAETPGRPDSKDRAPRKAGKDKATEVRLGSLDELVDYFIAAGKKGVAINRYKGSGETIPNNSGRPRWIPASGRSCRSGPRIIRKPTRCSRR